jgi:hypothetical protein
MGFGGGGSGSFVLPNHDHTNVLADGGELEELVTLVDGSTLAAWYAANRQGLELIENFSTRDSTLSSKTFTHTFDQQADGYIGYKLIWSYVGSAAHSLYASFGATTNWYTSGATIASAYTGIYLANQTNMSLCTNGSIYNFQGDFDFSFDPEHAVRPFTGNSRSSGGNIEGLQIFSHSKNADIVSSGNLIISLSSGVWEQCEMSLFGVLAA